MERLVAARGTDEVLKAVGPAFCSTLVSFLPGVLTAYRHQIEPLWREASTLYGTVAARRGLSAGEVIEEFHELRDGLLRLLFEDPPTASGTRLSLREILPPQPGCRRRRDSGERRAYRPAVLQPDPRLGRPGPRWSATTWTRWKEQLETMEAEGVRIMRILAHSDRT